MSFILESKFSPTGDQPMAIKKLVEGISRGDRAQVLLGVTGSGKTFTMANVIKELNKPTLILTHNKTLTAQLYGEFKEFFPDNAVEYFVSYYDYYQPEAYLSVSDTFIEKDLMINEEVDKLRLRATSSLLSGRKDIIIVASVSCIYGMGNPDDYKNSIIRIEKGQMVSRNTFLYKLVDGLYARTESALTRGHFRVKGDIVDIALSYVNHGLRIHFYGDEIEEIEMLEIETGKPIKKMDVAAVFPANLYVAPKDKLQEIIRTIEHELQEHESYLETENKFLEAKRIHERTQFDLEMIKELGYCTGIENYSRFFDGREPGARPFCLLDYFPDDYLMMIDESHATIPQIRGMWGGDRSRKVNLVNYGFRLPSAMDNRPLNFNEFETLINQVIFVSATPGDYELEQTEGDIVEQLIRPTGLIDPPIEVRPSINQIDDLLEEVAVRVERNERILVTTLTKRMAEELARYFQNLQIKTKYIHSEVDTMERVEILRDLRIGEFDVLVGVNLLREGLDLPEVSLVAIIDADKEGFLRNARSLTQTAGRAARNVNGKVIFYADKVTDSMQRTIDETDRRRSIQMEYNTKHNIIPQTLAKTREEIMSRQSILDIRGKGQQNYYQEAEKPDIAADPVIAMMNTEQLNALLKETEDKMKKAAKDLDFISAAQYRDELFALKKKLKEAF
ncbi:MAG: excinuclease ABC subunit UvrB [Saprospiraceae bacterium]|jgi:excinuclease ABC subunit B|uniref:excinuclease ABC subunit UvrB n=1 Tax=Candidatus Brachybacter algidus TaxID=2982024 RepID=UPI001B600D13|nr:excinuclease ABC subunit UvrB [Candidatus Brachybacter algidus]MBP7306142.1 excinuclease ABC subunit UvrB [Saprospiraceae bacterium]MBK6372998.1 excinuclease ABC subunit UvrB [Candidatus Brachybacter algidus]MBK6447654.1 excinuclease ABC subunit UvrB [Candidatus Brachybacter algidus]MBK7602459.1 excinuclease ABC subunit UvrB [Candidatus Brachybacter algidus]MBK8604816.1 excinuclease ABC subunit UvrB [Candidatus Brachybacter algidus]